MATLEPVFRRTIGLFKQLSDCNLDDIPYETLQQLSSNANQADSQFQQIRNFSVAQNANPQQFRDTLIQQLRDNWNAYYLVVSPHVAYAHSPRDRLRFVRARGARNILAGKADCYRGEE